jgi:RNA polymerase sigma-70 factor (ECF subfamily)
METSLATFKELYEAHFSLVWRTLGRFGVREADLLDMTQNVFVVVHRQLSGFEGRAKLTTWLISICRLVARDYLRSAPIRREVLVEIRELARRAGPDGGPFEWIGTQHRSQILEAILAQMHEKLRVVFVMFELEELSGEEIARLLDLPVGTVRSRLRLARVAFERQVRRWNDDTPDGDSLAAAARARLRLREA